MNVAIPSEAIEPFAAMLIGRMWARCEAVKTDRDALEAQCMNFWWVVRGLNKIAVAITCGRSCPGVPEHDGVHFSIAAGNEQSRVRDYIMHALGIDRENWDEWERRCGAH